MQTLDDIKKELRDLIVENELDRALELFRKVVRDDARLESDLILQQGQYNSIRRSVINGTASDDQTDRGMARIRSALLDMINNLKTTDLEQDVVNQGSAAIGLSLEAMSQLEREGVGKQLEISIRRLNALRESLPLQFDPNVKFALENQIAGLENEVEVLKAKLQQ